MIHHRFSSAPRSAPTVRGPPQLAPAPFVVPPSGGLSFPAFPAEAGTPAGSAHLEQATGWPRRSTFRVDPRFGTSTTRRVVRRSASVDFAVRIVLRVLSLPWCPCRPCAGRGEVWQLDAVVAKHRFHRDKPGWWRARRRVCSSPSGLRRMVLAGRLTWPAN